MGSGVRAVLRAALCVAVALTAWALFSAAQDDPGPRPAPPGPAPASRPASAALRSRVPAGLAADAPVAAAPPRADGIVRLRGSVVDDADAPVAGAMVTAVRGEFADACRTDAAGEFVLRCGPRPAESASVGLTATFGDLRAAFVEHEILSDAADEEDVGVLALERAEPLVARVESGGRPVAGATVAVASFFGAVFVTQTTDAFGVARFKSAPAQGAWLFAYKAGAGRARGEVPDARDPKTPLVLALSSRTIRVRVVTVPGDAPVAGERIVARLVTEAEDRTLRSEIVPAADVAPTDAQGMTAIADLGADDAVELVRIAAEEPQGAWTHVDVRRRTLVVPPRATEALFELPRGETYRWRIVPGETPPPPEGGVVALRGVRPGRLPDGPRSLRVEEGHLVGHGFFGFLHAFAVAPDGSVAEIRSPGGDARFFRPRTVEVVLRDESGVAIVCADVSLRTRNGSVDERRTTDAGGRARFEGLEPSLGRLEVWTRIEEPRDVRHAATVDAGPGDVSVDVTLPRVHEVLLDVTVDGEARLPDAWRIFVNGVAEATAEASGPATIRVLARTNAMGEIALSFQSEGLCPASSTLVPDPSGTTRATLAVTRGATLDAMFIPPSDPSARSGPGAWLQVLAPAAALSVPAPLGVPQEQWLDSPGPLAPPGADGVLRKRFEGLPPGRYRVRSRVGEFASDPVEVVAGGTHTLRLDLSRAARIQVAVAGPDGVPLGGACVEVEDPAAPERGALRREPCNRVESAGRRWASVVIPGDRPVRLVAWHPTLRPDGERGAVVVTTPPTEPVALVLAGGATLSFQMAATADSSRRDRWGAAVLLFDGPAEGPAAASLTIQGWSPLTAGCAAPGRATVWVLLPVGAPQVFPAVELREGVNDLGTLRSDPGSSIRARFAVPAGQAGPEVVLTATRLDPPVYGSERQATADGEVALPGLGPGRFEFVVRPAARGGDVLFRKVVTLDGSRDVAVDVSLR